MGALIVVSVCARCWSGAPMPTLPSAPGRWIVAFALVLVSAIVMTQRLLWPPREGRWPPFPPRPTGMSHLPPGESPPIWP